MWARTFHKIMHAKSNAITYTVTQIKLEKQIYAVSDVRHWIGIIIIKSVLGQKGTSSVQTPKRET